VPRVRPSTLALLSAAAATVHEAVWSRLLGRVVGNTAWGVGLALAVFLAGMGAGALGARRLLGRGANPARAYVRAEIAIGVGAAIADAIFLWAGLPSAAIGLDAGALALGVDLLWATFAAGLPALAIGATYPFLVAATDGDDRAVSLYRAGLAGGVAGVLASALLLVPRLGVDGAAAIACSANLLVAALGRSSLGAQAAPALERAATIRDLARPTLLFAAAGALGVGAQVVWNRVVVPYAGVSTFTFSAIVAAYLCLQAVGMALGARFAAWRSDRAASLALALAPAAILFALEPAVRLSALVPERDASTLGWVLGSTGVVAVAVGPAALLLGVAQARALRTLDRLGDGLASAAALVSGVGTIASACVGVAASLALHPALGPRWTVAALGGLAGLALGVAGRRPAAATALVVSGLSALLAPGPRFFLGPEFDDAKLVYAEHGVQDTVAILHRDLPVEPRIRRLVSNGTSYSGDSLYAQRYMRLLAHLPALAARSEDRALVICVGTGSTAAALTSYRYRTVVAVDLSPSVRRTLRFFRAVNAHFERDPRVRFVVADGDRWLRSASERFDVITLEPPPPRAPGASALYAREFYRAARARLAPGGVVAQWLPLHGLTGWEVRALVATFLQTFPRGGLYLAERNEAILLSRAARTSPAGRLSPRVLRDLSRIGMDDEDPLAETLAADAATLQGSLGEAAIVRAAWPAPELRPLAGPAAHDPLDAWIGRVARARSTGDRATSAQILLPAVAPFVRIQEGRGSETDRAHVAAALVRLLLRDPDDPYVEYMIGYGEHLERRLRFVADPLRSRARALIDRQRAWAREEIDANR